MRILWRRAFQLPHTYFLLVGTGLGYVALVLWVGPQPLVFGVGGAIALAMILAWFWGFRASDESANANLLEPSVFQSRLAAIAPPARSTAKTWQTAQQWATESHQAAIAIAQREPTLTPDLLEALYTVLALTQQVAKTSEALEQVQTETYRTLTQQHLQASRDRLQETHQQLQQLQDQVLLADLSREAIASERLPMRLKVLIDANKTVLQPPDLPPN